jgi:LuxR family quorum sensing-dependent transcriptional regulator
MTFAISNTPLETVEALKRAPSVIKVKEIFRSTAEKYGFTSFLCSAPPRPGEANYDPLLFDEWPAEWRARYRERRYYVRDPMLHEMFATSDPFTWTDALKRRKPSRADRAIVEDASAWEMCEGLVVPLYGIGGSIHAVTMAGRRPRVDGLARAELHLVSIYSSARAKELKRGDRRPTVKLTWRERDALQYAALGKTDSEIGDILRITESAAHKRIESAKRKFGVFTRMQAVVEAIRQGHLHF